TGISERPAHSSLGSVFYAHGPIDARLRVWADCASRVAKNLLHDPARLAVGDALFLSVVEINQLGVLEAEKVQERGVVIIRAHGIDFGLVTKLVGLTVHHAAFEAAAATHALKTLPVLSRPAFSPPAWFLGTSKPAISPP